MDGAVEPRGPAQVIGNGPALAQPAGAGLCPGRRTGGLMSGQLTVQCDRSRRLVRSVWNPPAPAQTVEASGSVAPTRR
jgi:hypothetical protein